MKEKFIEVYDNLVPPLIQNYIEDYITNQNNISKGFPLYYSDQLTSDNSTKDIGFSHSFFEIDNVITKDLCLFLTPLNLLSQSQNLIIDNLILGRVFLQIPTLNFGPQTIHRDVGMPHWVCLYYVSNSDGDTIFYDKNNKEINRVSPKKGRIAFFDGSIDHCGSKPQNDTRIVINTVFLGKQLN
jgi:hypothetical protein